MSSVYRAQSHPATSQNRRFAHSPIDALIDLKVRCRLRCPIPISTQAQGRSSQSYFDRAYLGLTQLLKTLGARVCTRNPWIH